MSKNFSFAVMPSVSISRSKFARKSQHKTTFNLGKIVPIYCDEVLPGDTRTLDFASVVRMSQPIAPIMDNIYMDLYAFFVPNRLCWIHWKEFMGENNTGAGIPLVSYSVPRASSTGYSFGAGSLGDYFGLPTGVNVSDQIGALPFRAFALIYNRWFRNENIVAPLPVNTGDSVGALITDNQTFIADSTGLPSAMKLSDYFTTTLPYAQKGAPVALPLGTTANIIASSTLHDIDNPIFTDTAENQGALRNNTSSMAILPDSGAGVTTNLITKTNLVADLSTATAATINDLRYAFQLQKLLEKDALYGTRYWELLKAHFGVEASDASLQDPEYLGGRRVNVNIDQVLSTAGYDDTSAQEVGKPGAVSVTGSKGALFTKSFTEHGWLIVCAVARHDQTYKQGINRMFTRYDRFDYYWPVFANLGAQEVKLKELYATGTLSDDNSTFGYQEAWAEYRYKPSIASGLLNPNVTGSLDYWTLTNKFAAAPTLGQTFIEQGRDNLARALATGNTGPDFIADFYFIDTAVRPMPMYSIPGLIDHH